MEKPKLKVVDNSKKEPDPEPEPKQDPRFIPCQYGRWYKNKSGTLYIHEDGGIARLLPGANCKGCLQKYQVRHPQKVLGNNVTIRVSAKLVNAVQRDFFICNKAEEIFGKGKDQDFVAYSSMKMCLDCGVAVTLLDNCQCGKNMEDKEEYVGINITEYEARGTTVLGKLSMKGYPEWKLVIPKSAIKKTDMFAVREKDKPKIALRVKGPQLVTAIVRSIEK